MTTLYQVDHYGYFTGVTTEINAAAGFQRGAGGWFEIQPPSLGDGEYAVVNGEGWRVTTQEPLPIPVPAEEPAPTPVETAQPGEAPTVI